MRIVLWYHKKIEKLIAASLSIATFVVNAFVSTACFLLLPFFIHEIR